MDAKQKGHGAVSTEGPMERVVMDETAEQSEEAEVPPDDEREFATLARAIAPAAAREQNRMSRHGNVEAAVWLHAREKRKHEEQQAVQQTAAQFQWAASEKPRLSEATWEFWEVENVPRRCGHVYEQSRSSSTGSTSLRACSTLSQCSTTRSTCGCVCRNRATEEH